ncbi:GLPGLI family protein [Belliella buryatensis]|uniref:GLPGLI family protein n=1 Tax=Belliella buryatensis TaxID=1500549 RepID=A0A239ESX0_9BACT|nr:GLPGLI family protein [Belliella buryatensis]SNS47776.1 GLPGLI family protein [Belliella buryatensis]
MKKYMFVMLLCALWSFISQHAEEGAIIYQTKINMHKRLPAEREELKAMIPEFNVTKNILLFNPSESLYRTVPEEENPFDQASGGNRMVMRTMNSNETYQDRKESMITLVREFMGKKYLTKRELNRIPWKLENETKEIQGLLCKSASYTDENQRAIKAWYTEEIRIPLGPENFQGLPGLILEVAINDDDMIISADKIEWRALKKNELKAPKGGQEISDEAYRAMLEEQMKNMGVQMQGQGSVRTFIRSF